MSPPKDPKKYLEWLEKNRQAHTGKVYSPETHALWSKQRTGKKMPPRTEQWREKQRVSHTGVVRTTASREKQGASMKKVYERTPGLIDERRQAMVVRYSDPLEVEKTRRQSTGRRHTQATKDLLHEQRLGDSNPSWNGGITGLRDGIRSSAKYAEWREGVLKRDKRKDFFSGVTGDVEVHHVVPLHKLIEENNIKTINDAFQCGPMWDLDNGVTMLKKSHRAYHEMWGRK